MSTLEARIPPSITRHVDKLWPAREDLPALIESAEAVERTLGTAGFRAIRSVIDLEIATIDRELDGARTLEHADYARLHGRRGALTVLEDAAAAIVVRASKRKAAAESEVAESAAGESAAER